MSRKDKTSFGDRFLRAVSMSDYAGGTFVELAKALDVSPQQITNYASGIRMPSLDTARKICEVTGCGFEWLMTGCHPKSYKSLEDVWSQSTRDEREAFLARLASQSDNNLN